MSALFTTSRSWHRPGQALSSRIAVTNRIPALPCVPGSVYTLQIICNLFVRGEPDPGLRLHVINQLLQPQRAGTMASIMRMHGEHVEPRLAVSYIELGPIDLIHQL